MNEFQFRIPIKQLILDIVIGFTLIALLMMLVHCENLQECSCEFNSSGSLKCSCSIDIEP